jgi:hypothetical protein
MLCLFSKTNDSEPGPHSSAIGYTRCCELLLVFFAALPSELLAPAPALFVLDSRTNGLEIHSNFITEPAPVR